jgi:hypothetical protein
LPERLVSLIFYGTCILGMVLGGLVLPVPYNLLVIAQKSDECLDQLELERLKNCKSAPSLINEKSACLRVPATSDLYHGNT